MTNGTSSIAGNLQQINDRIARAAGRSGRFPQDITLVAISKTFSAGAIHEAYSEGVRHFGENRIQEWEAKRTALLDIRATWHFIGHLQGNKVRRAAHLFDRVDSIDASGLARKINSAAEEEGKRLPVLIEVRLGNESTKTGADESDLLPLGEAISSLPYLEPLGLMTIPPYFDDAEKARPYFRRLRELREGLNKSLNLDLRVLSMGMSHDFEVAIEEGATEVRIGSALFGNRNNNA